MSLTSTKPFLGFSRNRAVILSNSFILSLSGFTLMFSSTWFTPLARYQAGLALTAILFSVVTLYILASAWRIIVALKNIVKLCSQGKAGLERLLKEEEISDIEPEDI